MGKKKKKKKHLKSEHTGCKIIKALLQTLHKTFLYPLLLLREAGKRQPNKPGSAVHQLGWANTGTASTNPKGDG